MQAFIFTEGVVPGVQSFGGYCQLIQHPFMCSKEDEKTSVPINEANTALVVPPIKGCEHPI